MKILTIGGATQDVFIEYEDAATLHLRTKEETLSYLLLQEGGKIEVKDVAYSSGGGANNAAFSFKKQGFDVTPLIKIGDDEQGRFILQKLTEAGIPTNLVLQEHGARSGISFIIPSLDRDRTIFAYRGSNALLTQEEFPFSAIALYDHLYITSLSGKSSQLLLPITKEAKKHNLFVATNPGTSQLTAGVQTLRESLPYLDVLILNSEEAKKLMLSLMQAQDSLQKPSKNIPGNKKKPLLLDTPLHIENVSFTLESFFHEILSYGTKIVVVTNGAEGVYCATKKLLYFHASLPVNVVNTIGAGDAFGSTFVGALAAGKSIEQALRYGIINAASVISFMDTQQGLLEQQELEKKAQELDKGLLQQFSF